MFPQLNFIIVITVVGVQAVRPDTLDDLMDDECNDPSKEHDDPNYPNRCGRNYEEDAQGHLQQAQGDDKNPPAAVNDFPYLAIQRLLLPFLDVWASVAKRPKRNACVLRAGANF